MISLTPSRELGTVQTVTAALALAKRGPSLLRAKRAVEEMLATGRAVVELSTVEDEHALAEDLAKAGCAMATLSVDAVDVRSLRDRLGLTQEQFALHFGLDVQAVRNWETNRRKPDSAAASYLRVIARLPEQVSMALERFVPASEPNTGPAGGENPTMNVKAVALAMMEVLHPERAGANREFVNRIPTDRLGEVLRVAEQVASARFDPKNDEEAGRNRSPAPV